MGFNIFELDSDERHEDLLALWSRNLQKIALPDRKTWFYSNRQGKPVTVGAENDDGELVGSASLYARSFCISGEIQNVGIASDFSVDAKYKLFGPAFGIQKKLTENLLTGKHDMILAYPNRSAKGIFIRLKFSEAGVPNSWLKPISSRGFIREKLGSNALSNIVSFLMDSALRLRDAIQYVINSHGHTYRVVDHANVDFDQLWEQAKDNFDITAERSSALLNNRYLDHPVDKYRAFVSYKNDLLSGYIIFLINDGICEIHDLFYSGVKNDLKSLIVGLVKYIRKNEVKSIWIDYFGNKEFESCIAGLGFLKRENDRTVFIMGGELDRNRAFIFDGDMDV